MSPDELLDRIHRALMLQCGELSGATLSILKDVEDCLNNMLGYSDVEIEMLESDLKSSYAYSDDLERELEDAKSEIEELEEKIKQIREIL